VATELRSDVLRGEVEVRAVVQRLRVLRGVEQEELHLGVGVEREAHLLRALELATQHPSRVAFER
jgi:hypothetical protein